jgi:hypothetical protein
MSFSLASRTQAVLVTAHVFRREVCGDNVPQNPGLYSTSRLAVTARHHPNLQHAIMTRDFPKLLLWLLLGDNDDATDPSRRRPSDTEAPERVLGVHFCARVLAAAKSAKDVASLRKASMPGTGATLFHAIAYSGSLPLLSEVKRLNMWPRSDTVEDASGRTPMFYAAFTESEEACKFLLDWGFNVASTDASGHTVLQRCTNPLFADKLKRLGRYRDVFISYGHHAETSGFAKRLSHDLEREGVTTWIDSEIEQGARWRESIQDAVKLSGALLVVLSRKWVDSQYVVPPLKTNICLLFGSFSFGLCVCCPINCFCNDFFRSWQQYNIALHI